MFLAEFTNSKQYLQNSNIGVRVATSNQDLTKTREDEGRKKLQHKLGVRTRGSLRHQPPGLNESELATH